MSLSCASPESEEYTGRFADPGMPVSPMPNHRAGAWSSGGPVADVTSEVRSRVALPCWSVVHKVHEGGEGDDGEPDPGVVGPVRQPQGTGV